MAALPDPTVANGQYVAGKIEASLAALEAKYPGDADIRTLHKQCNTAAILVARALSQPDSTFGGSGDNYDPPSGGTSKGSH